MLANPFGGGLPGMQLRNDVFEFRIRTDAFFHFKTRFINCLLFSLLYGMIRS